MYFWYTSSSRQGMTYINGNDYTAASVLSTGYGYELIKDSNNNLYCVG